MADTPLPYIAKEPGDIMLAADWNQMQVLARSELRGHDHTDGNGLRIPRAGIADRAIDGSKVDPESRLTLKGLAVGGPLKVQRSRMNHPLARAFVEAFHARLAQTKVDFPLVSTSAVK